jgi:hypothetical protein
MLTINQLALVQGFKTVGVQFRDNSGESYGKIYTYKSGFDCEVGDQVVVKAPGGYMTIVDVVEVKPYAELASPNKIEYKWLVQRVLVEEYEELLQNEELAKVHLDSILAMAKQETAIKDLYDQCQSSTEATRALNEFFSTPTEFSGTPTEEFFSTPDEEPTEAEVLS